MVEGPARLQPEDRKVPSRQVIRGGHVLSALASFVGPRISRDDMPLCNSRKTVGVDWIFRVCVGGEAHERVARRAIIFFSL